MYCGICGKDFHESYWGGEYFDICSEECFDIRFWDLVLAKKEIIVVNGKCYTVLPDKSTCKFKGFGGRRFCIKILKDTPIYKAGQIITTTNLWYIGKIPRERNIEDTAEFGVPAQILKREVLKVQQRLCPFIMSK